MQGHQGWCLGTAALCVLLGGSDVARAEQPELNTSRDETSQARDANLEKQVETRFDKDATLKAQGLDVTVMSGKVILTGTTATAKDKAAAQRAAESVKGVDEVDNQIFVRGSKEAARPAGDPAKRKSTRPREATTPAPSERRAPDPNDPVQPAPTERRSTTTPSLLPPPARPDPAQPEWPTPSATDPAQAPPAERPDLSVPDRLPPDLTEKRTPPAPPKTPPGSTQRAEPLIP